MSDALISQLYLKLNGSDAPPDLMQDLERTTVESSLHLPSVATLTLNDPKLRWIDDPRLGPGVTVTIEATSGGEPGPIFDGEIVELEPEFRPATQVLVVRAFDRLHRLARGRFVRTFQNVTDGDLARRIASECSLQCQAGPTSQVHPYVIQHNETNLEFLRRRAAQLGFLVFVRGKTLHFEAPKATGKPVELEWGKTMKEFRPRLTTVRQVGSVVVRGWDPATRQEIVGQAKNGHTAPKVGEQATDGDPAKTATGGELAKKAFKLDAQLLVTDRPIRSQTVADQLAQAVADQTSGRFIEADASCGGNPALRAGASVKLSAVGERFGGTYLVTGATHRYAQDGYSTEFSVSGHLAATMLALLERESLIGRDPGLVVGVVTDNQDPQKLGRVKVRYPWLSADHASHWARVVSAGAGPDRGIQFLPEVNDEVLVGFEQGDMDHAYVLGGLWNGRDAPPASDAVQSGKVEKRVITSRVGHTIILDDSPSGGIEVRDKNGNNVVIASDKNALTVTMKGDVTLKADGNLTLEARGKIDIRGLGVQIDAGAATADIKGSLINLN